jgi:hypothetical protein
LVQPLIIGFNLLIIPAIGISSLNIDFIFVLILFIPLDVGFIIRTALFTLGPFLESDLLWNFKFHPKYCKESQPTFKLRILDLSFEISKPL